MKNMKIKDIIEEIMHDAGDNGLGDSGYDYDNVEYLDEVEQEDWTDDGKYQYSQSVYWSNKHNVYISVNETRSGSYFTDYYYGPPIVDVVDKEEKQVTKTVIIWNTRPINEEVEVNE